MATTQPGEAKVFDLTGGIQDTTAVQGQPSAKLSSGYSIPLVGLGTWKSAKGEVAAAVEHAIKVGYRHIDCAAIYGNEHEVGAALQSVFSQGIVKREELFITSKLWNTHHASEAVETALLKTLKDLQLSYLDLYLIHWPSSAPGPTISPPIIDTWRAMEKAVEKGLVRSIGVSNFSIKKLQDLLTKATIPPAVDQVEAHPYWRNDRLFNFAKEHNIHLTAYSPLGSPDSAGIMNRAEDTPSPLKDATVNRIAQELGKNPGQMLIKWAVQRGTSVLPKSVNPARIESNLDVLSWELPKDKFDEINNLPIQIRLVPGVFLLNPAGPYKTLEDLWDEPTPSL